MENGKYDHSVTILGLCIVNDCVSDIVRSINETKRVYTLNDFYRPIAYPWLDKQCCHLTVFQIHTDLSNVPVDRFQNWKHEYNYRADKVIVNHLWEGLENQELYPMDEALMLFPVGWFQSSFGYMTALAYMRGIRDFYFYGFSMREATHYRDSVPGCLYIFETLRKMGCSVYAPMEQTWRNMAQENGVDWKSIPSVGVLYG